MIQDLVVTEIHIEAPPSVVFEWLVEPHKVRRWMAPEPIPRRHRTPIHSLAENLGVRIKAIKNSHVVFAWPCTRVAGLWLADTRLEIVLRATRKGTLLRLRHWRVAPTLSNVARNANREPKNSVRTAAI